MSDQFHRDHQITDSRDVAVLAVYLGYPLIRVEAAPDGKTTTYTLNCPQFDFEDVVKEATAAETTVMYASLQKVNALVGGRINFARKNAVWSSFTRPMTERTRKN